MGKTHRPDNHPEFPEEKGKILSGREKKILHAVRDAVNSVHDFSQMRNLKTLEVFQRVKKTVSKNLAQSFDEKVEKAIQSALDLQVQQYQNISGQRFNHRRENPKLKRDFHFLLKAAQFLNQWSFDTAKEVAIDFLDGKVFPKFDDSDALKAMRIFIQSLQGHMKKKEIKEFIEECSDEYQN